MEPMCYTIISYMIYIVYVIQCPFIYLNIHAYFGQDISLPSTAVISNYDNKEVKIKFN